MPFVSNHSFANDFLNLNFHSWRKCHYDVFCLQVVGHKMAPLKRMVKGSVEWARLESAGDCTVKEFIESLDTVQGVGITFNLFGLGACVELIS